MPDSIILRTTLSLFVAMHLMAADDANLTTDQLLDMDLDQLMNVEVTEVYGASKIRQKTTDAPSSVSIITARDIKHFGYKTLGDAVASQSGFYTYYDRDYQYLGVRGFGRPGDYNTRILLMIDGQRINDNIYDAASVGTDFPLDMSLIDHIEVIRGPGSALYGTSAFFAVINVVTKDADAYKNGEVAAEAGSFDTDKARVTLSHRFENGASLMISASDYYSGGQDLYFKEYDTPETNHGVAKGIDKDRYSNLFLKAGWGDFTMQIVANDRKKWIPTAAWEMAFGDPHAFTIDQHRYIDLKYSKSMGKAWQMDAQVAYNAYDYEGDYPYDEDGGIVVYKDDTPGRWIDGNIDFKYTPSQRNRWLAGFYYYKNIEQKLKYYDEEETINEVEDRKDNYAFYLQNIYDFSKKLSLTTGVRYDHYATFGSTVNPRVTAIYHFDKLSALKLLYGQAFRAPNIYERLYSDGEDSQKGNPDLKPEKIKTYEAVYEHYFENNDYLSVSGFYYKIDDLITQVEDPADELLVFENVDSVKSKGVEFNYRKKFAHGIETTLNYTYQNTVDDKTDKRLSNSPMHVANLSLLAPFADDRYTIGTTLQYNASRYNPKGEKLDDFVVANLTLNADDVAFKGLDLSASVYNLFDTKYASSPGEEHLQKEIPQDGIHMRIRAIYRF